MNDPQRRDRPSPPDGEAAVPPGPSAETQEALLTPAEVAALFRVDPKTVTRWAVAGKLDSLRTLGGHRRYRAAEVHALLAEARGTAGQDGVVAADGTDGVPAADGVPGPDGTGHRSASLDGTRP